MKRNYKYSALFSLCLLLSLFTACVKTDYPDLPDRSNDTIPLVATHTIAQLQGMYIGDMDSVDRLIIISGVVIANDKGGNIYKEIFIRDASGAICIAVDKTGLYNLFPEGQRVFIICTGLYVGRSNGRAQIGYRFKNSSGNYQIGRMPDILFDKHVFKSGAPESIPEPIEVTDFNALSDTLINSLVRLKGVSFDTEVLGLPLAERPPLGENPTSTDRKFFFEGNASALVLRSSSASRFTHTLVPVGTGDITAIYSVYNGTKQFYLRRLEDLSGGFSFPE